MVELIGDIDIKGEKSWLVASIDYWQAVHIGSHYLRRRTLFYSFLDKEDEA